jgi:hypothetical protein
VAKIVITKDRGVWRVSRRVLGTSAPMAPGLIIARGLIRLVTFPVLLVMNVLGLRAWRVEARTIDARPVVWYVRGTRRAKRVAREAITALVDGRSLDEVLPAVRANNPRDRGPTR